MRKKHKATHVKIFPRKIISVSTVVILLFISITLGYWLGSSQPLVAKNDAEPLIFGERIADCLEEQEKRCARIEQINVENELQEARRESEDLASHLDEQEQAFAQQQEEMENLEDAILNALMLNLSDITVSRSSPTVASYAQKAKELLSLSYKAKAFHDLPEAEAVDISDYEKAIAKQLANIPTKKPIPGKLSGYGYRIHPIYKRKQFHPAVDMGAAVGTPIHAAGGGRVTTSSYHSSAGNYIAIDHGNGFQTRYLHCSKLYVRVGQYVNKGDVIGAVGNTGTSTTSHLHFEVSFFGSSVNPNQIIME